MRLRSDRRPTHLETFGHELSKHPDFPDGCRKCAMEARYAQLQVDRIARENVEKAREQG